MLNTMSPFAWAQQSTCWRRMLSPDLNSEIIAILDDMFFWLAHNFVDCLFWVSPVFSHSASFQSWMDTPRSHLGCTSVWAFSCKERTLSEAGRVYTVLVSWPGLQMPPGFPFLQGLNTVAGDTIYYCILAK